MASARKDVELVIRARDQATKAFDSIAKAANALSEQQDDLAKSGSGVDTALGRIGQAVTKLDQVFKGLSVKDSLTKQFTSAQAESDRLQKAMAETAAESQRLAKELDRAGSSAAQLNARTAEAAAAVTRQGEAAKKAKAAQRELNTTLNESIAARDKLVKAEARLTSSLDQQPAKVAKAQERFARLSKELEGMVEPTATFQERFEASVRSLAKAEGKLASLQGELEATRGAIVSANTGIDTLTVQLAEAGTAATQTSAKLAEAKAEYKDLGAAAKQAANEQKTLVRAQEDITAALAQAESKVEQAGAAMTELSAEQKKAEAAMASLAAEARGPLLKAFSQQQSTMSQINNSFQANRKEIAALGAEMGRVGVPTREMVETYNKLLSASNEISAEYRQQKAELGAMRAALREGVTDIDQLNAVYQRFGATLNNSAAALSRVRGIQAGAAAANAQLAASAERAAAATAKTASGNTKVAGTARQAASATDRFSQAVRSLYGESRTAMSWTQRLRGEILSLIAAYSGFYGVINVLGQVIGAYQTLEAATSRLNVVMEGDESRTAEELDFVRRTAERLGIEFGSLAQEYSKFSIATKGTNLEGANTRKIFVAVAESARVNKVSMDEMAGTFVALTQIVSKGAVQMEELRQQLGDRLPGAMQIMADGLGVTTAELIKMMEQGQVSSDALIGFADELTKRFGPQLANSLNTVTANMGFLQNTVTATLLAFGQAGFMDSFNELLIQMNETLRSSDFTAFLARISKGVASLVDLLTFLIANWRVVATVMTTVIAVKMIPFVMGIVAGLKLLAFNAKMSALSFTAVRAGMASVIPVAGAATGAVTGLSVAIRALMSSTGIGLLVAIGATAFTLLQTGADNASDAMEAHRKTIDAVKNAYDAAGDGNKNWAKNIEGATATDIRVALEKSERARTDAVNRVRAYLMDDNPIYQLMTLVDSDAKVQVNALRNLIDLFDKGEMKVDDFRQAVSAIAEETTNARIKQMAEDILEASTEAGDFAKNSDELRAALRVLNGTATEADEILLGLRDAAEAVGDALDPTKVKNYEDALRDLMGFVPELADELERMNGMADIDAAYQTAMANAQNPGDNMVAEYMRQQAIAGLDSSLIDTTPLVNALDTNSAELQAFYAQIKGSANLFSSGRAGPTQSLATLGSSEWMKNNLVTIEANGIKTQVNKAAAAAFQGFVNELEATGYDITSFGGHNPRLKRNGKSASEHAYGNAIDINPSANPMTDKLITDLPKNIALMAAKYGLSWGGDWRGQKDAMHFEYTGRRAPGAVNGSPDQIAMQEQAVDLATKAREEEEKRVEAQTKFLEGQTLSLERQQLESSLAEAGVIERETALAIYDAQNEAKKLGITLDDAELQKIRDRVALQYASQANADAETAKKEEQAAIEQRVNDLLAQRTELEAQLAIHKEAGDSEAMVETEAQILAVNEQLREAIANATAMHEAIGGAGADASIAKLQTMELEAQKLATRGPEVSQQWQQVGQMFASGLTNAFMSFAQAVANGEDALTAAKDAFLKFAADFLIKIAEMIIQQAILNALQGAFGGGGGGGGLLGGLFGTGHTGGIVGSSRIGSGNGTRRLNPAIFAAAPRFHEGGFPGLMPGEVPAVLQEGEEVLSKSDARNALNGGGKGDGGGGGGGMATKIVNAIDSASFLDAALSSKAGEKVILNYIRANAGAVKSALG